MRKRHQAEHGGERQRDDDRARRPVCQPFQPAFTASIAGGIAAGGPEDRVAQADLAEIGEDEVERRRT